MRKLSSSMTFFHKRVFPAVWFGFIVFWTALAVPAAIKDGDVELIVMFSAVPLFMAGFGYVLMRTFLWNRADEVYLDGDELVVRWRGEKDRFPVANILNVEATLLINPERITLTLREPCRFGDEIAFSPPMRLWNFTRHPLANELVQLAHAGRRECDSHLQRF